MRHLIALVLLLPAMASAEVLVRHCDTPTATSCAGTPIWVKPPSAINVQVQRTGAPFVRLSDVAPTERIAVCVDDPAVVVGSSTTCSKRVADRNDLWELKAALYQAVEGPGSIILTWPAVTTDDKGGPLTDITYRLYGGLQGQGALRASNLSEATTVYTGAAYGVPYCFWARAVYRGAESDDSPHGCITLTESVVKPAAPVSMELKSTTTLQ